MGNFKTFAEYLVQRERALHAPIPRTDLDPVGRNTDGDPGAERVPRSPILPGEADPVSERSMSGGILRGVFTAVNPARPVSPINSRLLASPHRKRLKSQVMGR